MSKIAVIILNWNGYDDTIECLNSLVQNDHTLFDIIVVDNGSEDDSVSKIQEWLIAEKYEFSIVQATDVPKTYGNIEPGQNGGQARSNSLVTTLVASKENLGFSAGNNLGIRYAFLRPYKSVFLLNNDTTLEPDTLGKIWNAMNLNPDWGACVPKIKYYDSPSTIWNAGGFLRPLGGRRYLYANEVDNQSYSGLRHITFATGCALAIRSEIVKEYGGLSEDFFFGEEDYEFSKRLFAKNVKMCAVLDAVVYHKVGISRAQLLDENTLAYDFTHHLNRLIHMKRYMSIFQWKIWRLGGLAYILFLLVVKKKVPLSRKLVRYFQELVRLSNRYSKVDKKLFLASKEILK